MYSTEIVHFIVFDIVCACDCLFRWDTLKNNVKYTVPVRLFFDKFIFDEFLLMYFVNIHCGEMYACIYLATSSYLFPYG